MKTLEEHNRQHSFIIPEYPRPNGIACPKCGEEMNDRDSSILASLPPKKNVFCPKCGHSDYALA